MNITELLKRNIAHNGHLLQKVVAVEELIEVDYELRLLKLKKSIQKDIRGLGNVKNLAEEIADVEIVLQELKIIYDIEDIVEEERRRKLERMFKRLEARE